MNFYSLRGSDKYKDIEYAKGTARETIKCPTHDEHQRSGDRIGDLKINIKGPLDREFYWTPYSELVVSEIFVDLLNKNKLTGFKTKPAEVINRDTDIQFFEFIATGQAQADNIKLRYQCNDCGMKRYKSLEQPERLLYLEYDRLIIDPANWDGSDVFKVEGAGMPILVTERAAELIASSHLNGVEIVKAENFNERVY